MTNPVLLRRDQPLEHGRRLRFTFTIEYEVPVDDDLLQGETTTTLQWIEDWLGDHNGSEKLWRALHENYDRDVIAHTVALADVHESYESPLRDHRFELDWEREVREGGSTAGAEVLRRSRTWLDAIPAPSVGASA